MRETVNRHLLTFVLFAVLFWYTAVSPAPAPVGGLHRASRSPEDREEAAEEEPEPAGTEPADDLDWPEYIDG